MSPPLPSAIGRYEVRERIGQGGMGALYLALDPKIERLVALKVLRVDNDEMRARFLREARAAGRLHHPYVVTVFDVGEHDGQPFIAMEYVKGETLAAAIKRRAPIPLASRLRLMEYLCEGLQYAHESGLVHRDIKPANLMVTFQGQGLKILDFGIARGAGDAGLTEVGMMMGTPNYMSPEQASGREVDHRSDIFAVGSVIYETLLYRQAYPGKDWQLVLPRILQGPPETLTEVDPRLDPELNGIVATAMALDPVDRYQDLRSVARDLQRVREQLVQAQAETTITPTSIPTVAAPSTPRSTGGRTGSRGVTDKARLDTLRKQKVRTHIEAAESALARGDLDGAMAEAEDASLLDDEDTQVIRLVERLTEARDHEQFEQHLEHARDRLGAEALTEALSLVDQALALQPEDPLAAELRGVVVDAFEARDHRRQRARQLQGALDQARTGLESGALETAIRAASEVLAFEPDHAEAAALKERALTAAEQRRRDEAAERNARRAVETAREEFDVGDHRAALARLEPYHTFPFVAETLDTLRREAAAIERRLKSGEAAHKRSVEWVEEQVRAARAAIGQEQWNDAAALLTELQTRAPRAPELPDLTEAVRQGQLRARRQTEVESYLAAARLHKLSEDFPAALSRIDAALAVWPGHDEATRLRAEIEDLARTTEQRRESEAAAQRRAGREAVEIWLNEADTALRAGRVTDALKALEEVDPEVATTTQTVRFRDLRQDAQERRRMARAKRAAARKERVAAARQRVDRLVWVGVSGARRVAVDRRLALGLPLGLIVALGGWWLWPSGPLVDPTPETSGPNEVARLSSPVPPIAPLSSVRADDEPGTEMVGSSSEMTGETASAESPADDEAGARDRVPEETSAEVPPPVDSRSDPVPARLAAVRERMAEADFVGAFERLDALSQRDQRVARARQEIEREWNAAAQEAADTARELSRTGDFDRARSILEAFAPAHGFVDAARDDVDQAWAADADVLRRRALQLAADGDHQGAVSLLEGSVPAHPTVLATLDELRASPACAEDLPGVREALVGLRLAAGTSPPEIRGACDGGFRFEIQNELVRFGTGCDRASATAFVPVLCSGSSQWLEPRVLRFLLRKTGGSWSITEAAEMPLGEPAPR